MARVVEAKTRDQISSAEELIREYAASLGIDLSFENFEREMAEFPGPMRDLTGGYSWQWKKAMWPV